MKKMITFKVKEDDRQGWGSMALITAGQFICIPALMVGGMLGEGLSFGGVFFCAVAGGLILLGCACFMGAQSCRSGLPSTIVSAEGLGVQGARCISALLISIASAGWFGIQTGICGASFSVMAAEMLGLSVPAWAAALFWGLVMTLSAINGYRILKFLYHVMAPALFLVLVYTIIHTVFFSEAGLAALLAWCPERPISYITGITLVVGYWARGAFVAGDYCRYGKTPRGTALGVFISIIAVLPVVFAGGAIFFILAGNADITAILTGMGFSAMALIFLILAAWTLNMMNAYVGGIALSVLMGFTAKRMKLSTALTGIFGTVLGAVGIWSRFTDFLGLLSSLVPPVVGVLVGVKIAGLLRRRGIGQAAELIPSKPIGGGGGGKPY
jgi:cytosine permease